MLSVAKHPYHYISIAVVGIPHFVRKDNVWG